MESLPLTTLAVASAGVVAFQRNDPFYGYLNQELSVEGRLKNS